MQQHLPQQQQREGEEEGEPRWQQAHRAAIPGRRRSLEAKIPRLLPLLYHNRHLPHLLLLLQVGLPPCRYYSSAQETSLLCRQDEWEKLGVVMN